MRAVRRLAVLTALVIGVPGCGSDGAVASGSDAGGADSGSTASEDAADTSEPDAPTSDVDAPDALAGDLEDGPTLPVTDGVLQPIAGDSNFAIAEAGWYRGDFHYHTNYSEDAERQGGDSMATAIAIADAYRDAVFVDYNPDLAGNGLDFITITDHRTDAGHADPAFTHEHLIIVPGEEYGGGGHAGIFGLQSHVSHDAQAGESQNDRHNAAIAEAHAQGAVFSVNHPVEGNNWIWDTPEIDAIEVWNGPWAGFYIGSTLEELDADVGAGTENPFIRDALLNSGGGFNDKALRFWQNHLTAGRHVAIVGGSDRHMIVPAALPATYVHKPSAPEFADLDGPALGYQGIVEGVREGGTFISRSPFGAQVVLEAVGPDGTRHPMGAELPGPGPFDIVIRVSRAQGGLVQLIAGPLRDVEDGMVSAEPEIVFEEEPVHDLVEGTFTWSPGEAGGWLHAIVRERLVIDDLPDFAAETLEKFRTPAGGDGLLLMAEALLPLLDGDVVFTPEACDPATMWDDWSPQCMPADPDPPLATYYLPDRLERLVQIDFEDDEPTDWAMGAISSAFYVPASE